MLIGDLLKAHKPSLVENVWVRAHCSGAHWNFCRYCWKLPFLTSDTKSTNVSPGCTYILHPNIRSDTLCKYILKQLLAKFLVVEFLQLLHFCLIWIFLVDVITWSFNHRSFIFYSHIFVEISKHRRLYIWLTPQISFLSVTFLIISPVE